MFYLIIAWGQATFKYGVWEKETYISFIYISCLILHVSCIFEKLKNFKNILLVLDVKNCLYLELVLNQVCHGNNELNDALESQ